MGYKDIVKEHNEYCGVTAWHEKGFTGKGITVWNCEKTTSDHGIQSFKRVLDSAPDANVIAGTISMTVAKGGKEVTKCGVFDDNGNYHEINDWITKNNVKIITCSLYNMFKDTGTTEGDFWKSLIDKYGLIIVNCAGNDGNKNFDFSKKIAWYVGALIFDKNHKPTRAGYSSTGEGIDFADFAGWNAGTSFSAPYFAGKCALVLQRYPNMTPKQVYEYMKFCSLDLGDIGEDNKYGWGLPILSQLVLEKDGGENMKLTTFDDVPEGAWYEKAVEFCLENGYMNGMSEKLFEPNSPLTRAQMAQVLYNIFNKEE